VPATEFFDEARWRPDVHLLNGLSLASVAIDSRGTITYANAAAAARFVPQGTALLGEDALGLLFPATSAATIDEVLARVLTGVTWTGDLPVLGPDGTGAVTATAWSPVFENGAPVGALILVEEPTGNRSHARRLAHRLQRLAAVTSELLVATDVAEVTNVVIDHMAEAAGATVSSLSVLVDLDTLALVGMRGGRDGAASRWATYPVRAHTPAGDSLRAGRALVIVGTEDFRRRYPDMEMATGGERSLICLPLTVTGRGIGVVSLSFPGRRTFDPAELEFLGVLADTCAQALDRIRAVADVADREAKLRFLADASAELASSLDYESTLRAVAHLAVPRFADWCVIQLLDDGVLRPLAVAHPDEVMESHIADLQDRYPPHPDAPRGAYHVVRTGRPELVPEITDDMLVAAAVDEHHLRVLRDLQFRSALQVPLTVHENVLGVITWVAGDAGRRFTTDDLAFGEDLARRAAVAIDNSHLHSQIRDVAIRLQRAVLPASLPTLPGWDLAACYLPAGRTEVGGDFYDIVPLSDARVAVFIGDVMGRGVSAASAMAQMRSALRTLIALDPDPHTVMAGLDRLFAHYDFDRLVTVVYAVADPANDQVHVINAGHPAPLLVQAAGGLSDITTEGGLLLGAGGAERDVVTRPFMPGDTLLLFTDGLIERRHQSLDQGHRRVHDAASLLANPALASGVRDLVDAVRDDTRDDDIAAVALRRARSSANASNPQ
jgi:GAF domain-containing protein